MTRPTGLVDHRRDGEELIADLRAGASISVGALSADVLRFRLAPSGMPRARQWRLTDDRDLVPPTLQRTDGGVRLATEHLVAEIDGSGRLSIASADGRVWLEDGPGPSDGPACEPDHGRCRWAQRMPRERRYVGFGERTGPVAKRGRRFTCWTTDEWRHQGPTTDPLYVAIPFHLALDPDGSAFGVLMDVTHRSAFDLRAIDHGRIVMEVEAPELEWLFIGGPEPAAVVERLTAIVGRIAMPPRWALGYHQARWSYASEDEVRTTASALRRHRFPSDAIHLDIDHMDGFRVFSWDRTRFPDPARLVADLEGNRPAEHRRRGLGGPCRPAGSRLCRGARAGPLRSDEPRARRGSSGIAVPS